MADTRPTLHLMCGKIASGKSTLAATLSGDTGAVLIVEDDWLHALFAEEMKTPRDFLRLSRRLRAIMGDHIAGLLEAGISVVLDFHANTLESRTWMREIIDRTGADHRLHLLDVSDEACLERLARRNASGTHAFDVSEDQFRQVTRHFVPPSEVEGFRVVVHRVTD